MLRIFPSAGSENLVYPHFIPLFFLLSCFSFFLWRIYFDFSFSISFSFSFSFSISLSPLLSCFSFFLWRIYFDFPFSISFSPLPASFPGEGKFKLQGVIGKRQNWWWVFRPKFHFFLLLLSITLTRLLKVFKMKYLRIYILADQNLLFTDLNA